MKILDPLGDNSVESFAGSQAELQVAARRLFTSLPRLQPLAFEALSLETPAKTVPPTPGTALQQKLESKLEKSLGSQLDIQLDQKMGAFQASILRCSKKWHSLNLIPNLKFHEHISHISLGDCWFFFFFFFFFFAGPVFCGDASS